MRFPIRTSFGSLFDIVSRLDIRCLRFLLYLEFLIDGIQLSRDFLLGNCDLFWQLGIYKKKDLGVQCFVHSFCQFPLDVGLMVFQLANFLRT